jgi:hypothetical protein
MMRGFLGVVAACFIGLGIAMIILLVPRMINAGEYHASFESALMAWVAALTPGAMTIIFGSVTYMLCSIDARLQAIAENGRTLSAPKVSDPFELPPVSQQPPVGVRNEAGDSNHGLF